MKQRCLSALAVGQPLVCYTLFIQLIKQTTIIFYHNAISSYTMMGRISIVFIEVIFATNPLFRVYCLFPLTSGHTLYTVADPGFPRGAGANSSGRGGAPTYDFAKFSRKLHEIERIWTPGGRASKNFTM